LTALFELMREQVEEGPQAVADREQRREEQARKREEQTKKRSIPFDAARCRSMPLDAARCRSIPLVLKGKVTKLVEGAVNCEATLEIAPETYAQTIAVQD
jgi:hypothetical protein